MQNIDQNLLNAVITILTAAISAVCAIATTYIKEKNKVLKQETQGIKNDNDKALANSVLNEVDDLIETNITSVENTMKDVIIKGINKGDYTTDNLKALGTEVITRVKNQLAESSMLKLQEIRKDVDGYLANRMEQILANLKINDYSTVQHTVIEEVKQSSADDPIKADTLTGVDGTEA